MLMGIPSDFSMLDRQFIELPCAIRGLVVILRIVVEIAVV